MKYYTYIHATPEGDVFYVGKGTGRRYLSMSSRHWHWHELVNNYGGLTMKIVSRFETEQEAFSHEIELISYYKEKGCNLINISQGGSGPMGYMQPEASRLKKREKMVGYQYKKIKCPNCGLEGGETSMKRWHFDKCTGLKKFKSRASINGKRVFLGNYATKQEAEAVKNKYLAEAV